MLRLLDEQLGRALLGLAIVVSGVAVYLNQPRKLPEVPQTLRQAPVYVELDKKSLVAASSEVFFLRDDASQNQDNFPPVIVHEQKKQEFVPVDLPLPPAGVMRPPQILPDPGPSLEGTHKLPRFGDEFPPVGAAAGAPGGAAGDGVAPPRAVPPRIAPPGLPPDPKTPPRPGPAAPMDPRPPAKVQGAAGDTKAPARDSAEREDRRHGAAREKNF